MPSLNFPGSSFVHSCTSKTDQEGQKGQEDDSLVEESHSEGQMHKKPYQSPGKNIRKNITH